MMQTAIAIDQLLNALLGGFADETLSARAWREGQKDIYLYSDIGILHLVAFG